MAETDNIVIEGYEPGPVEVYGRRLKMEYIGMASVFTVIATLIYDGQPWLRSLVATLGSFFLFLGLKKKNRDHLMCSMLLFAAAALARPAVLANDWALALMLFGATVFSLERYLEKRPQQVYGLPLVFAVWGWFNAFWLIALLFAVMYLLYPRDDRPGARKILLRALPMAAVAGAVTTAAKLFIAPPASGYWPTARIAHDATTLFVTAVAIVAVLTVTFAYWGRLIAPHRINPILFAALAPWDLRLGAAFGMVGAVLMAATVFRHSIDAERLRPLFKHAEWHFFYLVLVLALWAVFLR